MNEKQARSILQVGTDATIKELFDALKERRNENISKSARAQSQKAFEYLRDNFSELGAKQGHQSKNSTRSKKPSPTPGKKQKPQPNKSQRETSNSKQEVWIAEDVARTILRVGPAAANGEIEAGVRVAMRDPALLDLPRIQEFFALAARVLKERRHLSKTVYYHRELEVKKVELACAILRVRPEATRPELQKALEDTVGHHTLNGNTDARDVAEAALKFLQGAPHPIKDRAASRISNPTPTRSRAARNKTPAHRKDVSVQKQEQRPKKTSTEFVPPRTPPEDSPLPTQQPIVFAGIIVIIMVALWWFAGVEQQSRETAQPTFTPKTNWIGRCVNQRTEVNKWTPNRPTNIVVCPGPKNRVFFHSEYTPSIFARAGEGDLKFGYFFGVEPCGDLFDREIAEKDVLVCRTKRWRYVGSKQDVEGVGTLWQWMIYVKETEQVKELFDGGVPFSVTAYIQERTRKPIKRLRDNPVAKRACSDKYYRTTRCVTGYFQAGQTYTRPPPLKNTSGKSNCFFATGHANTLRQETLPNGGWRYEKRRNTGNPGASIFFELGPGENVGGYRCPS